jgi:putative GTP pyrophosphokinase
MGLGGGDTRPGAADVETVLAEFDSRVGTLKALCDKTKGLVEELLQDANVRNQSVQARVKNRKKLREKYLDPAKDYKKLDDIHDLAGLRVITYYDDEVDRVAEVIEREFEIDRANTDDKRKIDLDRFGYSAINYVCTHLKTRASLSEYRRFANVCLEIQVTSILSHAWSEMNHGSYDLGESCPSEIRRRFFQLKALLELADSQFTDLRNKTTNYERAVAVQVEAGVSGLPLDAVSLRSLLEQEPLVAEIDVAIAQVLGIPATDTPKDGNIEYWVRMSNLAGLTTLEGLRDSLRRYGKGIVEYVDRVHSSWGPSPAGLLKGLSVFQLAMLLIYSQGEDQVLKARRGLQVSAGEKQTVVSQIAIAREIVAKYPK